MKAVWIEFGRVANVTVWDENSSIPEGATIIIVEDVAEVGPGFAYENGQFVAPKIEVELQ